MNLELAMHNEGFEESTHLNLEIQDRRDNIMAHMERINDIDIENDGGEVEEAWLKIPASSDPTSAQLAHLHFTTYAVSISVHASNTLGCA